MKYAKYISETYIDESIPTKYKWNGQWICGDLTLYPEIMAELGMQEYDDSAEYPEVPEGYHAEERYAIVDNVIVKSYIVVEDPPVILNRSISKRKLMNNLKELNLWTQVKAFMEQYGYLEDWETSTTLDEQDILMQGAIQAVQQMAGLTDEEINNLLENSIVD